MIDKGSAMLPTYISLLVFIQEIKKIDKFALMDLIQKACVKWDIERDENFKFFHGLINQKRRNQMINGIMVEGNGSRTLVDQGAFQFILQKENTQPQDTQLSSLTYLIHNPLLGMYRETHGKSSFHIIASGLKINIHKSNIYGIGLNKDEVFSMASNAGCIAGDIPFSYLSLPIGSNLKSIASWKTLVDLLGGNKDENKMAWVKWLIILNAFDKRGLNIGSLKAFNLALLQKWRWRLLSSPNALWVKVIKAISQGLRKSSRYKWFVLQGQLG
ncbi:hypothetical protein Tco_0938910 [Tanacetum coccineum]|uniref:Uncharacterized protein n=1 Tax=Tanacetum coccineum TaxID=301880 RepID=A0ABQ5DIJ1_9ASTR